MARPKRTGAPGGRKAAVFSEVDLPLWEMEEPPAGHEVGPLEVETGAVRARVSAPGGAGPFQVVISPPSCAGRIRLAANRILVGSGTWGIPFEVGRAPDLEKLGHAVARRAGLGAMIWEEMPATCTCPDRSGGCEHVRAAIVEARRKLSGSSVTALRVLGFDLGEWAGSQEALEAGVYPRRLGACWRPDWKGWRPRPLDGLPDLSAIPNLLETTLARLDPHPFEFAEDFGEILRQGLLTAAEGAGKPPEGVSDPLPLASPESTLSVVINPACQIVTLFADTEWMPAEEDPPASPEVEETFADSRASDLAAGLGRVAPEEHGRLGESDRYWAMLFRYVKRLAEQCALVPELVRGRMSEFHRIVWRPATMLSAELRAIHRRFVEACPPNLLRMRGITDAEHMMRASPETQVRHAVDILFRALLREGLGPDGRLTGRRRDVLNPAPMFFETGRRGARFVRPDEEDEIQGWLRRLAVPRDHPRLWAIFAPDRQDPRTVLMQVLFADAGGFPAPLGKMLGEQPTTWFLLALETASRHIGHDLMAEPGRSQADFSVPLDRFMEVFPGLERMFRSIGARLDIEANLAEMRQPRVCYRMARSKAPLTGRVDFSALVDFDWGIAVDDAFLEDRDSKRVMREARAVRRAAKPNPVAEILGGRYVLLGRGLWGVWADAEEAKRQRPTHFDLLRAALTGRHGRLEVAVDPSVKRLVKEITSPRDPAPPPPDLAGVLRPYQRTGFEWLAQNASVGFGSILADDMGLGKTLQAIALILHRTSRDPSHKTLVVAPTALLTNWVREIRRFAPGLRTQVHHGAGRSLDIDGHDVIVSSYGIVSRDTVFIESVTWGLVVVDEAQNIKNPATRQSKAIKSCKADARVALTGTPVENRLDDFWSIIDYANPGYLGSHKGFRRELAHPIERYSSEDALRLFRQLTGPFILRRLKTDKRIIGDLPEKIEGKQYCSLAARQATLYRATIKGMMEEIAGAGDERDPRNIRRRGLILKMLTALKQICDSPSLYLGRDTASPSESGKLALCLEILRELGDTEEKTLIFSQYVAMGKLLVDAVRSETGEEPLFLHGGLSRKNRDAVVDAFQDDPGKRNMVLSLKVGGTGLNLTAATQVIHFDRWWNPAVERQATDRAHRIGQTRRVQVHLLVTENTLEERIDAMLEKKRELAEMTVQSGETWLTEMSNRQLRELVEMTRPLE